MMWHELKLDGWDAEQMVSQEIRWLKMQHVVICGTMAHLLSNLLHIAGLPTLCLGKCCCLGLVAEQDVDVRHCVQQRLLEGRHLTAQQLGASGQEPYVF
jgi:hypothetical protein